MAADEGQRKLAAILAADVVGYSRLMADDERATVAALKEARGVFKDRIEAHGGRLIDTAGDSVLAEFRSVVEAVQCAVEVQEQLTEDIESVPDHRRMYFRIGVNLGDVIEEADGTIYGDGVNIAARLEGLAEPGGVMISESAHMQVRNRLDAGFQDAGAHTVKNISEPVHAYRLALNGTYRKPARGMPKSAIAAGLAAVIILIVGGVTQSFFNNTPNNRGETPTDVERLHDPALATSTGPSIAVLPFTNMSGDEEQEYFADGISEDLITELSRFEGLLVIARNSTFRFKGKAVNVAEVAKDLGVDYVLEGGVRRFDDRVRITAQLIDADTGGHLWAERYDRELTDVFVVQDDVTRQIIAALRAEIGELNPTRGSKALSSSAEAYELFLKGRAVKNSRVATTNPVAEGLLREAISIDPAFAAAYAELSHTLQLAWYYGWRNDTGLREEALSAAEKAVALDRSLPVAHLQLGMALTRFGRFDEAIDSMKRAVSLDTNYSDGLGLLAYTYVRAGNAEDAIATAEKAITVDPLSYLGHSNRGLGFFAAGDYEEAIRNFETAVALNPNVGAARQVLTAAYALAGFQEAAQQQAAIVVEHSPDFAAGLMRTPFEDQSVLLRIADGLRRAGLDVPDPTTNP